MRRASDGALDDRLEQLLARGEVRVHGDARDARLGGDGREHRHAQRGAELVRGAVARRDEAGLVRRRDERVVAAKIGAEHDGRASSASASGYWSSSRSLVAPALGVLLLAVYAALAGVAGALAITRRDVG